jgi:peptidoglycan/LPS O-acetylase OafA/YrhL
LALLYLTVLLLALQHRSGPLAWLMRRAWLRGLGTISYSVYLVHTVVLGVVHALVLDQPIQLASGRDGLVTLLALAFTLGLGALSWGGLEKPILRWGRTHRY